MSASAPLASKRAAPPARLVGRIPVRNMWLLMLFASDLYRTRDTVWSGIDERLDELPALLAEMLARIVERRRARGLTRGYQGTEAVLSRMRGRIDVLATERRQLLQRGLVACRFEELTFNTPRNQLVLAALLALRKLVQTDKPLAQRCQQLAVALQNDGVQPASPSRDLLRGERYGRHDAEDRLMVEAARLALELAMPNEEAGDRNLPSPDREGAWVRKLFERAIGGFYRTALDRGIWDVTCGGHLDWPITRRSAASAEMFPGRMITDIVLDHRPSGLRLIVDTKFSAILSGGWYREEVLRTGHVYQMYAYLRSQTGRGDRRADGASGLLLHPSVGRRVDEAVELQGHRIRFATVDLTGTGMAIRARLLEVVQSDTLSLAEC